MNIIKNFYYDSPTILVDLDAMNNTILSIGGKNSDREASELINKLAEKDVINVLNKLNKGLSENSRFKLLDYKVTMIEGYKIGNNKPGKQYEIALVRVNVESSSGKPYYVYYSYTPTYIDHL